MEGVAYSAWFAPCTSDDFAWLVIVAATLSFWLHFQPLNAGLICHPAACVFFHHHQFELSESCQLGILDTAQVQQMLDLSFLRLLNTLLPLKEHSASFRLGILFWSVDFILFIPLCLNAILSIFDDESIVLSALAAFNIRGFPFVLDLFLPKIFGSIIIFDSALKVSTFECF